jgi:Kef-type K+ transport system membrane component KefB
MNTSVHATELALFFTLLQLAIIVIAARLAGTIAVRYSQSRAVGEIIAGILLGPSLFGLLFPEAFAYVFRSTPGEGLTVLSQIGLILLMFQIGMEFDFGHLRARQNRRAVLHVAAAGELFPFVLGFTFGHFSAPYLFPEGNAFGYSLFCAVAFTITALPILGRIMIELDLQRTALGAIAISAAAINDVLGWILLAVVSALVVAQFSAGALGVKLALLAVYVLVCWFAVRPLLRIAVRRSAIEGGNLPLSLLGILLAAMFLSAMATYQIGIFAIFGGFLLGVLLHDQRPLVEAWRNKVGDFVNVFFLPIFFTYTGLRTDVAGLAGWDMWMWCLLLVALATLGKFGGCYWAARRAGLGKPESRAIGAMMNTRALMELVVINIGFDLGVIPPEVFTMLVIMAIVSTAITTPLLRTWLKTAPAVSLSSPARSA